MWYVLFGHLRLGESLCVLSRDPRISVAPFLFERKGLISVQTERKEHFWSLLLN